jgi:hypothetical protein
MLSYYNLMIKQQMHAVFNDLIASFRSKNTFLVTGACSLYLLENLLTKIKVNDNYYSAWL